MSQNLFVLLIDFIRSKLLNVSSHVPGASVGGRELSPTFCVSEGQRSRAARHALVQFWGGLGTGKITAGRRLCRCRKTAAARHPAVGDRRGNTGNSGNGNLVMRLGMESGAAGVGGE